MRTMPGGVVEVLLVEDNPGDVLFTIEALEASPIRNSVHVVQDGEAAIRYLSRSGEYAGATRPDLVLLDLNLPRRSGHEVLAALRGDPETRTIPVVVLTSSERRADVEESYGLSANCYVTKPFGCDRFHDVVESITSFWFEIARLP